MESALESAVRWGVKSGVGCNHLVYEDRMPVLFRTRAEAREWIKARYGYIRKRKDLRWTRIYPWRMPTPIRVKVVEIGGANE